MVRQSVDEDLKKLPEEIQKSGYAAIARSLADALDHPDTSPNAKAIIGKTLADTLDRLRALAPDEQQEGKLDDLRARRADRRSAA